MEEKKGYSTLDLICFIFSILIVCIIILRGSSIYDSITKNNELSHKQQTQKVEIIKREPIKRLYKDAFNERK